LGHALRSDGLDLRCIIRLSFLRLLNVAYADSLMRLSIYSPSVTQAPAIAYPTCACRLPETT